MLPGHRSINTAITMGTIIAYFVIIALLVRSLARSGKKSRGRQGEKKVSSRLRVLSGKGKGTLLNDVLLRRENGGTSQIDHVFVTAAGVFSIETKNYRGVISGEPGDQEWVQTTRRSCKPFESPIMQNRGHIEALRELLGQKYPDLKYHSLVVFPSRHLIHVEDPRVVSRKELQQAILSHTVGNMGHDEVREIARMIRQADITSRRERRRHIREVKRMRRKTGR